MLKWLFGSQSLRRGYVYAPRDDPGAMRSADAGRRVANTSRRPPWLVVFHELTGVRIARWPGRLWEVEVVDAISNTESGSPIRSDAGYTRAAAVEVLREVPIATLFGANGEAVCAIINSVDRLTLELAEQLAAARHPDAGRVQTRIWRSWFTTTRVPKGRGGWANVRMQERKPAADDPDSFDGVLEMAAREPRSPLGQGLAIVSAQVGRRAESILGRAVWLPDPDDDEGAWLAEPWSGASMALLDAALAFGAPHLASDEDRSILATAWRRVLGRDPAI